MNEYIYLGGEILPAIVSGVFSVIPGVSISLVTYILFSLGLYAFAKRRGIKNPWLAWIPVGSNWILGSLSDQYRYVTKGEIKNKRKAMLALSIIMGVLFVAIIAIIIVAVARMALSGMDGSLSEQEAFRVGMMFLSMLGLFLPLWGIGLALTIVQYIALYDLYRSADPDNRVLYIVLSIVVNVTMAFFVFFLRNKDNGMPPRKEEPVVLDEPAPVVNPVEEPWDNGQ